MQPDENSAPQHMMETLLQFNGDAEQMMAERIATLQATIRRLENELAERRHIESALQQAEARYRTLVEQIPAITYIASLTDLCAATYISPQCTLLGFSPAELIADPTIWYRQIHADDRERVMELLTQAQRTRQSFRAEYRIWSRDDRLLWFHEQAAVIRTAAGQPLYYQGAIFDITEQKQMAEALLRSEAKFRHTFEAIPYPTVLWTRQPDERIILAQANPATYTLSQGNIDNFIGAEVDDFFTHAPEVAARIKHTMETGEMQRVEMFSRLRTTGEEKWFQADYVKAADDFVLNIVRDITARKADEEQRNRLYAAERQARAEAEAALRMRDEVFAVVSHDIKNPLAVIRGQVQVLQQRLAAHPTELSRQIGAGLSHINAAVSLIVAQLDEILDMARLQAGQPVRLRCQPTDLVALVHRCVEEYKQTSPQHTIQVETPLEQLIGCWDSSRVERIIGNLLSNAIKYSPRWSVINVTVGQEQRLTGAMGVLTVGDHGVGIPVADLPHIFEFFRRGRNVEQQTRGLGLGLASVRRIVEQHGGCVEVASEEGVGTTFTVRLPLTPDSAGADDIRQ